MKFFIDTANLGQIKHPLTDIDLAQFLEDAKKM